VIDFAGYSYAENKATIVCSHVLDGTPVLVFVHDSDGDIQFMCGVSGHGVDDAFVVELSHLLEHIRSMSDIPVVEPGFMAERSEPGAPWSIHSVGE
jgi:hypothetical protein